MPAPSGGVYILSWPSLLRRQSLAVGEPAAPHDGMEVRALGYAMDGERALREGELVNSFVLLPDSGHVFHPAHRFGDQMITVYLPRSQRFRYRAAELVWAIGTLHVLAGDPAGPVPLYVLANAHVEATDKAVIAQFFSVNRVP